MTVFYSTEQEHQARRSEAAHDAVQSKDVRLETLDMKYRDASAILAELLKLTKCQLVEASEEDQFQLQESEQQLAEAEQDRVRLRLNQEAKLRENRLLLQATQAVGDVRV